MSDDYGRHPYMMHKKTFGFCRRTPEADAEFAGDFVNITEEQAGRLSRNGLSEGVNILREVVARDNAEALAEAEARSGEGDNAEALAEAEARSGEGDGAEALAEAEARSGEGDGAEASGPAPAPGETPWFIRGGKGGETDAPPPPPPPPPPPATVSQTVGAEEDYAALQLEQLREMAARRGIDGSRMSRRQIAAALAGADAAERKAGEDGAV